MKQAALPPALKNSTTCQPLEVLPVAPPPKPRKLTEEEIRQLEEQEEDMLRELRIYLRDVAQRLVTDKRFKPFTKPIDPEGAPNYKGITKWPMDLSTVVSKTDMRQYLTARDFLKDIDLICSNALEYKPNKGPAEKSKRKCKVREGSSTIPIKRTNVQFASSQDSPVEEHENVLQGQQKNGRENGSERVTLLAELPTEKKSVTLPECSNLREKSEMLDCQIAGTSEDACSNDSGVHHRACVGHSQVDEQPQVCDGNGKAKEIHTGGGSVDYSELRQVLDSVIVATENVSISRIERLYALLSQCIYRHREDDDKTELMKAMKKEIATLSLIHDFSIFSKWKNYV